MLNYYDPKAGRIAKRAKKAAPKKGKALQIELLQWIGKQLGEGAAGVPPPLSSSSTDLHTALQDGVVLCKLINKLNKKKTGGQGRNLCRRINKKNPSTFEQRENIQAFILAVKKFGVEEAFTYVGSLIRQ